MDFLNTFKVLVLSVVLLATGCAQQTVKPYDYAAFEKSKPRSILVIPPLNNSIEADAPYKYLSTITQPLAEKGYYVYPVAVIDQFLKHNGLPTPAEMNTISLDRIDKHIGADAVLYVTIEEWGQKYQVLASTTIVKAQLKLVDVKSGELLWEGTAQAAQSSGDGGGGIAGMLISALITQVAGSIGDNTPGLSAYANTLAINSTHGMLDGPYLEKKSAE
jgi:hypothetical protein